MINEALGEGSEQGAWGQGCELNMGLSSSLAPAEESRDARPSGATSPPEEGASESPLTEVEVASKYGLPSGSLPSISMPSLSGL